MAEPVSIVFPYLRCKDERQFSDVEFGRACVARALRTVDPDALGLAVEAVSRAVLAETIAKLVLNLGPNELFAEIAQILPGKGGARGC